MWNFLPWWLLRKAMDTGSSLLDDLVSYWPLDEISGVRYDAVGSNDLTDNNTVGFAPRGPEGTVASFVAANSEYLSDAGLVTDVGGGSFSWAAWIKNDPTSANCSYAGQALDGLHVVRIYSDTGVGGRISTTVYNHPADVTASVTGYSGDSWRLIVGGYDSASQKTFISVNGAAKTVSANTSAMIANIQSVDFWIGRADYPGYSTMQSGASGFWDVVLTDEQITALFAAGNGLRYADLPAGLQTGLVSWWELDEVSGVRYDSHGSNDLTDNNTVGSETAVPGAMNNAAASFVAANSEYLSKTSMAELGTVWTFSGWFKTTDGVNDAIFSLMDGATETARLTIQGSVLYFVVDASNTAGDLITNDLWYHFVAWCDGTKLYLSLNNSAAKEATDSLPAGTDLLTIGKDASNRYHDGQIEEVGYWSRVLTADERAELYNLGRGKYYDFS